MTGFKKGDKDTQASQASELTDDALFQQAMEGVTPLPADGKVHTSPRQPKAQKIKHPDTLQTTSVHFCFNPHEAENSHSVGAEEALWFHRKGIRLQELTRLKKAEFSIEGTLDLHGRTLEVADAQLSHFFNQAWLKKCRFLLIIHGKGYNSEAGHPVLKNLVNQRCQQNSKVLAFCSAQPKDGGTGAVYVFLKAQ